MPSLRTCSLSKLYHFGLIQSHSCKHHLFVNKAQIYVFNVDPLQIPERSLFGCLTGISNSVFSETNSWFLVHFPLHCDTHTHHLLLPHPPPCMSFGQDQNLGPPWCHFRIHQQIQLTLLSHSIQTLTTYHLHYDLPAPNHHLQQPVGWSPHLCRCSHLSSTYQPEWCFTNRCESCHFSAQSILMTLQITQNKTQHSYNGLKILTLSDSSSFSDSAFPLLLCSACQPLAISQSKFLLAEIEFSQTVTRPAPSVLPDPSQSHLISKAFLGQPT